MSNESNSYWLTYFQKEYGLALSESTNLSNILDLTPPLKFDDLYEAILFSDLKKIINVTSSTQSLENSLVPFSSNSVEKNNKKCNISSFNGYISGPLMLQIMDIYDISKPQKISHESNIYTSNHSLFMFKLSDGRTSIKAIEYIKCPSLNKNIPLGSKLLFGKYPQESKIESGLLILTPKSFKFLGGGIDKLIEAKYAKENMNREIYVKSSNKETGPPSFQPFPITPLKEQLSFISSSDNTLIKKNNKENSINENISKQKINNLTNQDFESFENFQDSKNAKYSYKNHIASNSYLQVNPIKLNNTETHSKVENIQAKENLKALNNNKQFNSTSKPPQKKFNQNKHNNSSKSNKPFPRISQNKKHQQPTLSYSEYKARQTSMHYPDFPLNSL